jgi:hypothetical protein
LRGKHYSQLDTWLLAWILFSFVFLHSMVQQPVSRNFWGVKFICYSLISLKREAFMFGASKTKHDDRGEDIVQVTDFNILLVVMTCLLGIYTSIFFFHQTSIIPPGNFTKL